MPRDKEKQRIYEKERRAKPEYKEYQKEYREKNKEKAKQKEREYRQTEAGKKSARIRQWKYKGIITEDYDTLYEKYLNTKNCELCSVVLTTSRYTTKTTRCLDHDHDITDRDNVRNIVCHSCNSSLPQQ